MSPLAKTLTAIFLIATFMGPGPGLYLINPPAGANTPATVLGIPAIYAWVAFWFFVQAGAVLIASKKIWEHNDEPEG